MTVQLPNNPARADVLAARPTLWTNPLYRDNAIGDVSLPLSPDQVDQAQANWKRLAPLLETCFPELKATAGAIRSDLIELNALRDALGYSGAEFGQMFVKAESALAVA